MQSNRSSKKTIFLLLLVLCVTAGAYWYRKKNHHSIAYIAPKESSTPSSNSTTNFFFDFEKNDGLVGTENIKVTTAHSGEMACDLSGGKEYGPSVVKRIGDIASQPIKKVSASVWIYPLTDNPNAVLTASVVNSKNESVFWDGKSTEKQNFQKNKWTKVNASYTLPSKKMNANDLLQINIWNKGKTEIIVDDIEIVYGESAERRGVDPQVDINSIYEKRFVPQKNKPPFKPIYFEKQEINNNNSTFVTPDKNDPFADFSPNDEFLVGNFIADKNNLDEIICIKNGSVSVFEYVPEKLEFKKILEKTNAEKISWNNESKKFVGDFNVDGKTDILVINNKTGAWELYNLVNQNWVLYLKGDANNLINKMWWDSNNKPFVSKIFSKDKNDELLMFNQNKYSTLRLNKKNNSFEEQTISLSVNDTGIFKSTSSIYTGNFNEGDKLEILKLDSDWRFDLKLIDKESDGFNIANTVDFKGYSNDYNPKYYEFVKIISGKFINSTKTSLLVMMRNCVDNKFDGVHCNQFENINSLPNSTQVYTVF